jgi:hypothetical protein
VASSESNNAQCISLALDWLSKLHARRVANSTGENVTASQVTNDEFRQRLERPADRPVKHLAPTKEGGGRT